MLYISELAEASLQKAREFMSALDYNMFEVHKRYTAHRTSLEDMLNYLRLYGCKYTAVRKVEPVYTANDKLTTLTDVTIVTEEHIDINKHIVKLTEEAGKFTVFNLIFNDEITGKLQWDGPVFPISNVRGVEFTTWISVLNPIDLDGNKLWSIRA